MISMRNNSLEACALTYVNHQRIACLEQKKIPPEPPLVKDEDIII